jgi:hypothetical protein
MKKSSLGCPSSARRKFGFENEVNSCISLVDAMTVKFLKYGAAFARAMTSAGYIELRVPEVVAMIA